MNDALFELMRRAVDLGAALRHCYEGGMVPSSERQMMLLDIAAVAAASIAGMVVGALWFSKALLGRRWADAAGVTLGAAPAVAYALAFLATAVTAIVLKIAANVAHEAVGGSYFTVALAAAVIGWLGFTLARAAVEYLFEQRSARLFAIDMGHQFAVVAVMGIIIGLFGP